MMQITLVGGESWEISGEENRKSKHWSEPSLYLFATLLGDAGSLKNPLFNTFTSAMKISAKQKFQLRT